jgi:type IV pilus assembly protein PilV
MRPLAQGHRGATLVEVMVAVLILSIGLLGVAGLQMVSLKSGHSAYQRSQATWLANDLTDRLRARRSDACSRYADGSDDDDRRDWDASLSRALGGVASGSLALCDGSDNVEIHIRWDDERGNIRGNDGDTAAGGQTTVQTFVFRTRI